MEKLMALLTVVAVAMIAGCGGPEPSDNDVQSAISAGDRVRMTTITFDKSGAPMFSTASVLRSSLLANRTREQQPNELGGTRVGAIEQAVTVPDGVYNNGCANDDPTIWDGSACATDSANGACFKDNGNPPGLGFYYLWFLNYPGGGGGPWGDSRTPVSHVTSVQPGNSWGVTVDDYSNFNGACRVTVNASGACTGTSPTCYIDLVKVF